MKCPYCSAKTNVTNSRPQLKSNGTWRRRNCTECGAVMSTNESYDYATVIHVSRPNTHNTRPFNRDILLASILPHMPSTKKAAKHAGSICDTVIISLLNHKLARISTETIVNEVQVALGNYDPLSGLKYASAHERIASKKHIKSKLKQLGN